MGGLQEPGRSASSPGDSEAGLLERVLGQRSEPWHEKTTLHVSGGLRAIFDGGAGDFQDLPQA